jgi:hypothetical protein
VLARSTVSSARGAATEARSTLSPEVSPSSRHGARTHPAPTGAPSGGVYDDVIRRLREEQEQLGQIIDHPF